MTDAKLFTRAFVLAASANLLHGLSFFGYLHLPGFLSDHGASELTIGVVVSTMAASAIALRPLIGGVLDRHGRLVVARVGSVINVLVTLAYLTIDSVGPLLFVVRVIHGAAEAMLFSVLFTIAADVVPKERRTEGIALFGVSGMIPMALSGLIGDFILSWAGYDELFIATSIAALMGLLCAWPLAESRPPADPDAGPQRSFWAVITQPPLRPLWLAGLSFAAAIASYFTFLKTFVEDTGVGSMGLFYSIYSLVAILLRIGLGWVPDRIGPRRTLAPAMASTIAGLVVLAFAQGSTSVAISAVLCGTGHAFLFPALSAMVVTRAAARDRGVALSMFTALFDLGLLVGAPLLGAVLEQTGYTVMFNTAAVAAAVGGLCYAVWDVRVAP